MIPRPIPPAQGLLGHSVRIIDLCSAEVIASWLPPECRENGLVGTIQRVEGCDDGSLYVFVIIPPFQSPFPFRLDEFELLSGSQARGPAGHSDPSSL